MMENWNLDGTEDISPWPQAEKIQTPYGLAYKLILDGRRYFATKKPNFANNNYPFWEEGFIPERFLKPVSFFPETDPFDDIVSIEEEPL